MFTISLLAFIIAVAVAQAARQPHENGTTRTEQAGVVLGRSQSGPTQRSARRDLANVRVAGSSTFWHRRFLHMRHVAYVRGQRVKQLKRTLLARPNVTEAINLACVVYGNCSTIWSLARCESTLNASAQNPSGSSGLMQFMPSTFASTPFGRMSIWSPYANAMAGGWMLAHGRRSEWVC